MIVCLMRCNLPYNVHINPLCISLHVKYELQVSSTAINDHMTTLTCEKRRGISNTSFYAFQKNFDDDNLLAGSHCRTRPWLFDMMKGQKVGASSESRLFQRRESIMNNGKCFNCIADTRRWRLCYNVFYDLALCSSSSSHRKVMISRRKNPICEQSHGTSLLKEDEVKSGRQQEKKNIRI